MMVFPAAAAQIHDHGQVAGLQGTGSCDVSLMEYDVPEAFTWDPLHAQPQRGGPLDRLGLPGFVANEHAALALGVGRCVLDTVMVLARSKRRGFTSSPSPLEARPVFQRAVGLGDLRLRVVRALVLEIVAAAWATLCPGHSPAPRWQAEMRSVAALATDVAANVTTHAVREAGGTAVLRTPRVQRWLRDMNVAAPHLLVSAIASETHGPCALDGPEADPLHERRPGRYRGPRGRERAPRATRSPAPMALHTGLALTAARVRACLATASRCGAGLA